MPDREWPDESKLWYILLGAMLASQECRQSAVGKIATDDVPKDVGLLWAGIEARDTQAVRNTVRQMGVDVWPDGVIPSITRHLQERAIGELCKKLVARAQVTLLQKPEELRDKFVALASVIDAKVTALDKSRAEGQEAAKRMAEKPDPSKSAA